MRRQSRLLPLAASLILAACSATSTSPDPASPAAAGEADLLARGEYLVKIGGCNDCHAPAYGEKGGDVPKEQWLVGSPSGSTAPGARPMPRTCG